MEAGNVKSSTPRQVLTTLAVLPVLLMLSACSFAAPSPTPSSPPPPTSGALLTPQCGPAPQPSATANPTFAKSLQNLDKNGIWSITWNSPPSEYDLTRFVPNPAGLDPKLKTWKMPIWVAPGAAGTVSIISPKNARLFVTTWERWNSLSAAMVNSGKSTSVDVAGCNGVATYPGMMIIRGATCVVFGIQLSGATEVTQVSVPFFGGKC